jgi:hypothetical protein
MYKSFILEYFIKSRSDDSSVLYLIKPISSLLYNGNEMNYSCVNPLFNPLVVNSIKIDLMQQMVLGVDQYHSVTHSMVANMISPPLALETRYL